MSLVQRLNRKRAFQSTGSVSSNSTTPMFKQDNLLAGFHQSNPIFVDSDDEGVDEHKQQGHEASIEIVDERPVSKESVGSHIKNPFLNENEISDSDTLSSITNTGNYDLSSSYQFNRMQSTSFSTMESPELSKQLLPQLEYAVRSYVPINLTLSKTGPVLVDLVQPDQYHATEEDEENGHFKVVVGRYFMNFRYKIVELLGQGTFGKVVSCFDTKQHKHVAIKIIKAVPKYRDAAKVELRVLETIKKFDPLNLNHCIHLKAAFDFNNHICLVTELLSSSVFDFHEKNSFISFPGSHIQSFAKQLITSVAFLHDLNIVHTDLKPENILLFDSKHDTKFYSEHSGYVYKTHRALQQKKKRKHGDKRKVLRGTKLNLIDFGSAVFDDEMHPDLISTRHYRAPEVAFGIGWSYECDLWSIGCVLAEMLIGEALFFTRDTTEHLYMMEKVLNERLDLDLIRNCCISSKTWLHQCRDNKRPYSTYGLHQRPMKNQDGYGAIPKPFHVNNVNSDVMKFLKSRGDSYLELSVSEQERIAAVMETGDLRFLKRLKRSSKPRGRKPKAASRIYGVQTIKQKFPKGIDSNLRKNVNELGPLEDILCDRLGIAIDMTLPVEESYFKYCLGFYHNESEKLKLLSHNIEILAADYSSVEQDYGMMVKNVSNSVCGGCLNDRWIAYFNNEKLINFFYELREKIIELKGESCKSILDTVISENLTHRDNSHLVNQKLPLELENLQETYINGKKSITKTGEIAPVDFETFKFWYYFVDLVKKFLRFDPYARVSAYEALNHEWFSCGIYDDGVLKI